MSTIKGEEELYQNLKNLSIQIYIDTHGVLLAVEDLGHERLPLLVYREEGALLRLGEVLGYVDDALQQRVQVVCGRGID